MEEEKREITPQEQEAVNARAQQLLEEKEAESRIRT